VSWTDRDRRMALLTRAAEDDAWWSDHVSARELVSRRLACPSARAYLEGGDPPVASLTGCSCGARRPGADHAAEWSEHLGEAGFGRHELSANGCSCGWTPWQWPAAEERAAIERIRARDLGEIAQIGSARAEVREWPGVIGAAPAGPGLILRTLRVDPEILRHPERSVLVQAWANHHKVALLMGVAGDGQVVLDEIRQTIGPQAFEREAMAWARVRRGDRSARIDSLYDRCGVRPMVEGTERVASRVAAAGGIRRWLSRQRDLAGGAPPLFQFGPLADGGWRVVYGGATTVLTDGVAYQVHVETERERARERYRNRQARQTTIPGNLYHLGQGVVWPERQIEVTTFGDMTRRFASMGVEAGQAAQALASVGEAIAGIDAALTRRAMLPKQEEPVVGEISREDETPRTRWTRRIAIDDDEE